MVIIDDQYANHHGWHYANHHGWQVSIIIDDRCQSLLMTRCQNSEKTRKKQYTVSSRSGSGVNSIMLQFRNWNIWNKRNWNQNIFDNRNWASDFVMTIMRCYPTVNGKDKHVVNFCCLQVVNTTCIQTTLCEKGGCLPCWMVLLAVLISNLCLFEHCNGVQTCTK